MVVYALKGCLPRPNVCHFEPEGEILTKGADGYGTRSLRPDGPFEMTGGVIVAVRDDRGVIVAVRDDMCFLPAIRKV